MQTPNTGRRRDPKDEKSVRTPSPGVVLWRPTVVVAPSVAGAQVRPAVRVAEPQHRPESMRVRVETARSVLDSLADARRTLASGMTVAQDRAATAATERERVSATIQAYRFEAALDEVLTMTSTQVSLLMKERGLR